MACIESLNMVVIISASMFLSIAVLDNDLPHHRVSLRAVVSELESIALEEDGSLELELNESSSSLSITAIIVLADWLTECTWFEIDAPFGWEREVLDQKLRRLVRVRVAMTWVTGNDFNLVSLQLHSDHVVDLLGVIFKV